MDKRILGLTPKQFLCPICGEWHDWDGHNLKSYREAEPYEYECNGVTIHIWSDREALYLCSDEPICGSFSSNLFEIIYFDDIECDVTESMINCYFSIIADERITPYDCFGCCCSKRCNFVKLSEERTDDDDEYEYEVRFSLKFNKRYFGKYAEAEREAMQKDIEECEDEEDTENDDEKCEDEEDVENDDEEHDDEGYEDEESIENDDEESIENDVATHEEKIDINNSDKKMAKPMGNANNQNPMIQQVLLLMLFKDELGIEKEDIIKMLILSFIVNGNWLENQNLIINYLLLDMFFSEK